MEKILFLAHAEPGNGLAKASLEVLTAAKSLAQQMPDAQWFVGFVGSSAQKCANEIAACGASKFLAVTGADFDVSRYATDAAAAEALCKATGATLVIAPGTSRWMRALPGVAQRLGGSVDTHVISLATTGGKLAVQRWFYRQRMEGSLTRQQRPWVILVDPGTQPAWEGTPGTATIEQVTATTAARTTLVGYREPAGDAKTLRPEAELLLVTGAGWTKKQADGQPHVKEAEKLISDCLKLTRASLGSTKSLVDLGGEGQAVLSFLTHLNQVGQTGSTPRHRKGLATCCHGEEPHTVGWRFITERRAINLDPSCGWARGKADVLYVADAFAVVSKLNELLSKSAS